MQILKNKQIKKLRKSKRKFFKFLRPLADIKLLVFAVAIILIWRGVWNITDEYLIPDYPLISNIIGILIGILILFLSDSRLGTLVGNSGECTD